VKGTPNILARYTKAGYGIAELGMSAVEVMLQIYLLVFYTSVVGLAPQWAGLALALAVGWDAITDPVMGMITDNTHSRWGKRRPYIAVGSIFLAVAVYMLFTPPELAGQWGLFFYLLVTYIMVNTSMTVLSVPHAAMARDLTFDRHERTELFAWRLFFRNLGFLLGTLLPGLILVVALEWGIEHAGQVSRQEAARLLGIIVVISAFITVYAVRRIDLPVDTLDRSAETSQYTIWQWDREMVVALSEVLQNRFFVPLLIAYVIAAIGRTLNASLALKFYELRLGFTEFQTVAYVLAPFMLFLSLGIAGWVWISHHFGKKWPAFWGALTLGFLTVFTYPLLPYGQVWAAVFFASFLGGLVVGAIILFDSLVADIVDYDELKTGKQREGIYFGAWTMATKLARALGLAATGMLLSLIGIGPDTVVSAEVTSFRIAMLFGPAVGSCFILAALVFLAMPLTDKKHRQVQRLLEAKRRRTERTPGPVSGGSAAPDSHV